MLDWSSQYNLLSGKLYMRIILHHHYIIVGMNDDIVELEDESVGLLVWRGQKVW